MIFRDSTLVSFMELDDFLSKEKENGYKTLRAVYRKLEEESTEESMKGFKSCLCGVILENAKKNRFKNILPYDKYRVILGRTWEDFKKQQLVDPSMHFCGGNYINASYIGVCNVNLRGEVLIQESVSDPKFIVTQNPLGNTIGDFWKMVYEQRSPTIVNLSGEVEDGEYLRYWPQKLGRKILYSTGGDRLWVQLVYENRKPIWIERHFKIWPEDFEVQSMLVRHMQYLGWATNHPPVSSHLLKFIEDILQTASSSGPIIVQSRGGIGRNGFFLVACLLKQNIEMGVNGVDLYAMIKHLRKYQFGLVNSIEHFIELHNIALRFMSLTQSEEL